MRIFGMVTPITFITTISFLGDINTYDSIYVYADHMDNVQEILNTIQHIRRLVVSIFQQYPSSYIIQVSCIPHFHFLVHFVILSQLKIYIFAEYFNVKYKYIQLQIL
jgi:hypothetical protein